MVGRVSLFAMWCMLLGSKVKSEGVHGVAWCPFMPFRELVRDAAQARFYTELSGVRHGEGISPQSGEAWKEVAVVRSRDRDDDVVGFEVGVGVKALLMGLGLECWFQEFLDGGCWIDGPRGRKILGSFWRRGLRR